MLTDKLLDLARAVDGNTSTMDSTNVLDLLSRITKGVKDNSSAETLVDGMTIDQYVAAEIAKIVDDAPENLDTLKEIADVLQNGMTFDSTPTENSTNPVTSGGVKSALDAKQDSLTFDSTPTENSTNPVTSGGLRTSLDAILTTCLNLGDVFLSTEDNLTVSGYTLTSLGDMLIGETTVYAYQYEIIVPEPVVEPEEESSEGSGSYIVIEGGGAGDDAHQDYPGVPSP